MTDGERGRGAGGGGSGPVTYGSGHQCRAAPECCWAEWAADIISACPASMPVTGPPGRHPGIVTGHHLIFPGHREDPGDATSQTLGATDPQADGAIRAPHVEPDS
jgi:hypothetical protein